MFNAVVQALNNSLNAVVQALNNSFYAVAGRRRNARSCGGAALALGERRERRERREPAVIAGERFAGATYRIKEIRQMKCSTPIVAIALSAFLVGCVAEEDLTEEDLMEEGSDTIIAEAAGTCWRGTLQVSRSGAWQNVGLSNGRPRVTSTMAARTWTVDNSRFMGTGGNWLDCGEAYDSSAPRACAMVASTATRRTSFHSCNGGSIHDCVYATAGSVLTVDNATNFCVDYDSNGYIRSYTSSSRTCRPFRITNRVACP